MGFYDLTKTQRIEKVEDINIKMYNDLCQAEHDHILDYFSDEDTYIRKTAYLAIGKIYINHKTLNASILNLLTSLFESPNENMRQTVVNAAGEIGKIDFEAVSRFFDKGLFDDHHSVRNAVIGSIKKMSERNPIPTLLWAKVYLHHSDKEIRREICHGIELRGRTHPQDILPMLAELQNDQTARVKNTLIHVLGQISYKKGCLETVVKALNGWENQDLVQKALDEIVDVHNRYKDFAILTQQQAMDYIDENYRSGIKG